MHFNSWGVHTDTVVAEDFSADFSPTFTSVKKSVSRAYNHIYLLFPYKFVLLKQVSWVFTFCALTQGEKKKLIYMSKCSL